MCLKKISQSNLKNQFDYFYIYLYIKKGIILLNFL